MTEQQVIIADARYIQGKPVSRVYHRMDNNCLSDKAQEVLRLAVGKDIAEAFGYDYCSQCNRRDIKEALEKNVSAQLVEILQVLPDLPEHYEFRIYYHEPDKKTPKKVWSSHDDN